MLSEGPRCLAVLWAWHTRLGGAQRANPLTLGFQTLKLEEGSGPAREDPATVRWPLREVWEGSALPLRDSFLHPVHLPPHPHSLCATKTQVLADFMIPGKGILMLKERSREFSL